MKKKEKEKEKKEKIPHLCESIGHRPLWGRCPKRKTTFAKLNKSSNLRIFDIFQIIEETKEEEKSKRKNTYISTFLLWRKPPLLVVEFYLLQNVNWCIGSVSDPFFVLQGVGKNLSRDYQASKGDESGEE